ncbi:hypothetical protein [Ruegeria sp. HKCCD8929]|uniref:hypothetical protein n=1 Tax=Ruegeria sp. HKCCD8929 TaxID=2683006 RepID=UPI0014888C00|nr:hypothetical protein [Ruegeria sp. HKCCD8929]
MTVIVRYDFRIRQKTASMGAQDRLKYIEVSILLRLIEPHSTQNIPGFPRQAVDGKSRAVRPPVFLRIHQVNQVRPNLSGRG